MKLQGKSLEALSGIRLLAKVQSLQPTMHDREVKRFSTGIRVASALITAAVLVDPAMAQSLKGSATSFFLYVYGVVGVLGAFAVMITGINWSTGNWMGREDPKKTFTAAIIGTGIALGSVALIQWLKDTIGANSADINNL